MATCLEKTIQIDIRFTVRVLRERLSVDVCASFPFVLRMGCGIRFYVIKQ